MERCYYTDVINHSIGENNTDTTEQVTDLIEKKKKKKKIDDLLSRIPRPTFNRKS